MAKSATKNQISLLDSFEQRAFYGQLKKGKSKVDEMKDASCVKRSFLAVLGIEVSRTLPTGEVVRMTVSDLLAIRSIQQAIANPKASAKDVVTIAGGLKNDGAINITENNLTIAFHMFSDIAINKQEVIEAYGEVVDKK